MTALTLIALTAVALTALHMKGVHLGKLDPYMAKIPPYGTGIIFGGAGVIALVDIGLIARKMRMEDRGSVEERLQRLFTDVEVRGARTTYTYDVTIPATDYEKLMDRDNIYEELLVNEFGPGSVSLRISLQGGTGDDAPVLSYRGKSDGFTLYLYKADT